MNCRSKGRSIRAVSTSAALSRGRSASCGRCDSCSERLSVRSCVCTSSNTHRCLGSCSSNCRTNLAYTFWRVVGSLTGQSGIRGGQDGYRSGRAIRRGCWARVGELSSDRRIEDHDVPLRGSPRSGPPPSSSCSLSPTCADISSRTSLRRQRLKVGGVHRYHTSGAFGPLSTRLRVAYRGSARDPFARCVDVGS